MKHDDLCSRRSVVRSLVSLSIATRLGNAAGANRFRAEHKPHEEASTPRVHYRSLLVDGVNVFYREAGPPDAPVILMLHGYPSSSRMFEPLFPLLSDRYRLIAPDYPGFGLSDAPDPSTYRYTFAHLAQTMQGFVDALGLGSFHLYMQDYGGPVGFRLALIRPEQVRSLIVQNAVIHEEGLSEAWALRRAYWKDRNGYQQQIRDAMYSVKAGIARHMGKRTEIDSYDPDLWMDEIAYLRRPGVEAIQLELSFDYQSNVRCYPQWQAYLRRREPRVLVVWGNHDPIFTVAGAQAIQRDLPSAEIHLLDAGHFALDDAAGEIAPVIRSFVG